MMRLGVTLMAALTIAESTTGCSALSAQPDMTRYFVLTPLAARGQEPSGFDRVVGIGPLKVPDYMEQQLVTRLASEEIAISDVERWSEPLDEALNAVLRQNLVVLLGTERIIAYPWDLSAPPDLAVTLNVLQMERTTTGTASFRVRWSIERGSDRHPLVIKETSVRKPIRGNGTRAAVAALSSAVNDFSRQVAAEVRRAPPGNTSQSTEAR
jgi:uncharacterized protein